MYLVIVFFIILINVILIYYKKYFSYWSSRNVKCDIPLPVIGNNLSIMLGAYTITEFCNNLCNKYSNEKIIGYYRGTEPVLVIRDPDLLKHIFTIDFINFHKRGLGNKESLEPLLKNSFFVDGDHWRLLRNAISPAFTGSKIRSMISSLEPNVVKLQLLAEQYASQEKVIEAYDLMARFIIECIGMNSFGVEMNTINSEKSKVLELGKAFFRRTTYSKILYVIKELIPNNYAKKLVPEQHDMRCFIKQIVSTAGSFEEMHKTTYYFDMLMELRRKGKLSGLSLDQFDENLELKKVEIQFDDSYVAGQLFLQFAAGFETSSAAGSYALYELAHHPKVQKEVQNDIDRVLEKHDNKVCFDAISEMTLLLMVVKESLRLFPPAGITARICTKDYKLPGIDLVIPKGMRVIVPIHEIHMDPKYYDEPSQFRPERFSPENVKKRHKYTYLPFGEGPRKCIGAQHGITLLTAGIVAILQKNTVEPASPRKYTIDKSSYLVQAIKGGLPIKLKPRLLPNKK